MTIHVHVVCGCFITTVAGLSKCNRDLSAPKAQIIYYLALYKESLPVPA